MVDRKEEPVIQGADDTIVGEIVSFADLYEEFPNFDFALLERDPVLDAAMEGCDDHSEEVFDSGMPGGCDGYFEFYSSDPQRFRNFLREQLRPLCEKNL